MTDPAPPQKGVIAVTGATGYIGRATVHAALSKGYGVVALGRRPPDLPGVGFQRYDLKDEGDLSVAPECVAIMHLAADTQAGSRTDIDSEVKAATRVIRAAREHGLALVFVSSQTASPEAATNYGRSKWLVEQIALEVSGCAVRPGLVYGGTQRGLFGQLCALVKSLPILPSFLPAPLVQPIHVDDLATGLIKAVEQGSSGVIRLAQDDPLTFTRFLRILARDRLRVSRMFMPFPAFVLSLISPIAAAVPRAPDLGRIQSLYAMKEMRTSVDLQRLGLDLRSLQDGMHRSGNGRQRRQLGEAKVLLTYILRQRPPSSLLRRYVSATNALYGNDEPLAFPWLVCRFPVLITAFERAAAKQKHSKFKSRLSCAILIAEASPLGAQRFMLSHTVHPAMALFKMAAAVTKDSLVRIGCLALARPLTAALKASEHRAQ